MNVARLAWLLLAAAGSLVACGSAEEAPPDAGPPDAAPDQPARDEFVGGVLPILATTCDVCHATTASGAPDFMAAIPDVYTRLTTYADGKLLSCWSPGESLLVTKGVHFGGSAPAFTPDQAAVVAAWLQVWAEVSPVCPDIAPRPVTAPHTPVLGVNEWDLSGLGPGLAGTRLRYRADNVSDGIYLSEMTLFAGAGGLHVSDARFESCVGGEPEAEASDAFDGLNVTLGPDASAPFGQGYLTFVGLSVGDPLAIRFDFITPAAGPEGPAVDRGGACE